MSDEMRLIQNNMQVIEELHHKIMALESVLTKWIEYKNSWSKLILKKRAKSPLDLLEKWLFISMHKITTELLKKLSGEKDVFESSKMIMHCFCCGTDITDETNCFCLTCFNDKIAHDIKKDMVISRELFNELKEWCWEYNQDFYHQLKEVEKQ